MAREEKTVVDGGISPAGLSDVGTADRPAMLLAASNVVAGYGTPIVRGVSLQVGDGEVVSIVGPNGCGKTTLLKALLGLISVTSGKIELGGEDITKTATYLLTRKQIGYVSQNREVFESMTVYENLQIAGHGMDKQLFRERLASALESSPQLAMLKSRRAGVLSGGERRILAIAMALLVPRRLLVLDEPTAALAPGLAAHFLESQVPSIAKRGSAVLIVEQRVHACFSVSDWAYSMVAGEIQMSGRPAHLLANDSFAKSLVG
ncbi:MAG TPA: ATP-binding cassette domain-containing protein [Acidimicrobiales bacterium]|nr:ATP-binding cassette domain-containing protein [Acidimicrobiales bacterium]